MLSGAGPDNARRAAETLIANGAQALLSWGCCAALVPELTPGTLLLPDALLNHDRRIATDPAWRQALHDALAAHLSIQSGTLVQSNTIIATPADKAALAQTSGAVAVDMESAAIAEVARQHGLPRMAVRAVTDPADMALPRCVLEHTNGDGVTHIGGLLLSLACQPTELPNLLTLGHHFAAAMTSLRLAAKLVGPDGTPLSLSPFGKAGGIFYTTARGKADPILSSPPNP